MKNAKNYAPIKFKETISQMNALFQGVAANDAKDLINFLIMTLHGELNKVQNPVDVGGGNLFQEQTNKELMFKRFAANFAANNQSIISDLFYALNCNVTKCGNCSRLYLYNSARYDMVLYLFHKRNYDLLEVDKVF